MLKDVRVVVMIFQYSACFGTELAMNNQLATHFRTRNPSFWISAFFHPALASAFLAPQPSKKRFSFVCFSSHGNPKGAFSLGNPTGDLLSFP